MTVSAQTPINRSAGNGVTTVFPYTFKIIAAGDIEVSVDDFVKTLNVDYTVTGAGVDGGGNVTMTVAPASGTTVVRRRNMAFVRTTDYQDQGALPAATLDNDIDAPVMMIQQLDERLDRTFSLPASSSADSTMPTPTAGYVIGWDALGERLTNLPAQVGSSLIDLAASSGASLVGYLPAGTGAVATDVQSKLQQSVYVRDYGADPTGVADSAADFQNAINEMVLRGGGTVWVEPGLYKISTSLYANVGVVLQGTTRTDVSANTNGGGSATAKPTILWTGTAGGYMYAVRPAVVGSCVWGGGSVDIEWNGNDLAAVAVHLDNTKYGIFDGKVRQVTNTGVLVNSASGSPTNFSMKNHIRSLEFVWGSAAACENANALALGGNSVNVPATQQLIGDVAGLVYNGALVRIAETDNAQFLSVHGSVQSGGTGCSVMLINAGAQPSHHNVFFYCVGPVKSDNGLIGNTFLNYNSEGGGFSQLAGTSSWDGELVDYVTGKRFASHKYALRDKVSISSGQFVGDVNTVISDFAFQWHLITLSGTTTQKAACVIPAPYHLEAGVIEGVEIIVGTNGTSAGNYRLALTCSTTVSSGPVVTPEKSETQTLAAGAQYTPTKYTFTFSPELAFANNDHIFLGLSRLGGDALDTNTDAMFILGARILYRSTGPSSGGSGTYTIPAWS